MTIESFSPEDTFALGKSIGEKAQPGQIYTLEGDLGTGKTVFTQGLAAGLGITEPVNSPTFTIVQVYEEGRLPLYHFDVYRIGDIEEMDEIGYEDYFYGEGVCLIEWAGLIRSFFRTGGRQFGSRRIWKKALTTGRLRSKVRANADEAACAGQLGAGGLGGCRGR